MKKFAIGLAVLAVFGIYSLGIRHQNPVLGKPPTLANTNSPNTTSTSSGSGTPPSSGGSSSSTTSYKDGTYTGSAVSYTHLRAQG